MSVKELATGTVYTHALETGWKPPRHIRALSQEECEEARAGVRAASGLRRPADAPRVPRRFGTAGTSSSRATTCRRPSATSAT
jgi:hypothetical protein